MKKKNEYTNYYEIKINDNKYLYYTKNKKDGQLYESTKRQMKVDNLNFLSEFDFKNANKIKKVDEERLNISFINFKNFIYYGDLIILIVIIMYIFYIFLEPFDNKKFNYNKIFNVIYELGILVFYIIRYEKFLKFKNFLLDNEDTYKDKSIYDNKKYYYFPNKFFNLDSFPISISINIILIRIIYLFFPQKCHYYLNKEKYSSCFEGVLGEYTYIFIKSKIICVIILFILPFFEGSYFEFYDNLIYNWNTNPIKSIEISPKKDYEFAKIKTKKKSYSFYQWRYNYFKIEKLKKFDYINIYKNENGKICGKDGYGNDLYFPNDVECPINDIIIDNNNKNYEDYKEIKLDYGKSLYYTNKNISQNIIIDLKAIPSLYNYSFNLNLKRTNGLCEVLEDEIDELNRKECKYYSDLSLKAYRIIDDWDYKSFLSESSLATNKEIYGKDGRLNLVGITYFGFDPSSIKERKKMKTIGRYLIAFKIFFILQIICFVLSTFCIIFYFICNDLNLSLISFVWAIILLIFEIIMYLISLIARIKYIHNFIFKIIYKYEENENEYKCIICFYIIILIANFSLLFKSIHFYYYTFIDIKKDKNLTSNENGNNKNKEKNEKIENLQKNLDTERLKINKKNPLESNKNKNENKINKSKEEGNNPNILIQIKKKEKGSDNNTELSNINNKKEDNDKKVEKSKFQISESNIKHKCAICLEDPNQVIIAPCGHRCLCFDCYKKQKDFLKKCPICQKNIISFIEKIYDL